jgi:hypothetical protein
MSNKCYIAIIFITHACVPSKISRYTYGERHVCCACTQCLFQLMPPSIILPVMCRIKTVSYNFLLTLFQTLPPPPKNYGGTSEKFVSLGKRM